MEEVRQDVLGWDLASLRAGGAGRGARPKLTRVPIRFQSFQQYTQVFRMLLLEELREQIYQARPLVLCFCPSPRSSPTSPPH